MNVHLRYPWPNPVCPRNTSIYVPSQNLYIRSFRAAIKTNTVWLSSESGSKLSHNSPTSGVGWLYSSTLKFPCLLASELGQIVFTLTIAMWQSYLEINRRLADKIIHFHTQKSKFYYCEEHRLKGYKAWKIVFFILSTVRPSNPISMIVFTRPAIGHCPEPAKSSPRHHNF